MFLPPHEDGTWKLARKICENGYQVFRAASVCHRCSIQHVDSSRHRAWTPGTHVLMSTTTLTWGRNQKHPPSSTRSLQSRGFTPGPDKSGYDNNSATAIDSGMVTGANKSKQGAPSIGRECWCRGTCSLPLTLNLKRQKSYCSHLPITQGLRTEPVKQNQSREGVRLGANNTV